MPPKKKKVKEPEANQVVSLEPLQQQHQQNLFPIPKKPFYRSVYLNSDERAKHIQIRRWKINSFKAQLLTKNGRQDPSTLLGSHKNLSRALAQLSNKQRAFKSLRRLSFSFNSENESKIGRLISRSWKMERLLFHRYGSSFPLKKLMKTSLNPRLKDFFQMGHSQKEEEINEWRCLVDCNIWFQHTLAINTRKNRSFAREIKGGNKNQVAGNVEAIFQHVPSLKGLDLFNLISMNANQLPNLKALRISYSVFNQKDQSKSDLDFIKNYPQLTSLYISTQYQDAPSLEFLNSLPNLKQFTMASAQDSSRKILKTLPLISSLEKLRICCHPAEFSSENLQEFFISNKDLKHLEVQFPLRDDFLIFHENLILPVETLKLFITGTEQPLKATTVKKLASFLSKNKHLKSLYVFLNFHLSFDQCDILLKGVTSMTCLEHLTWFWAGGSEIQESKLGSLKKILTQSAGIQQLELNFDAFLTSKDFSNILDGLVHLKKLKYLWLRGTFLKISPATLSKFLQLLRSLVFENVATVILFLQGIAQEMMEEINRIIAKKCDLYGDKNEPEPSPQFAPDWW